MKNLSSYLFILIVSIYLNQSSALFHQPTQSRQSSGQSAALFSHFGQPQQLANLTSASHFTQPFYYEYDRDPRQWLGGGAAGGYGGYTSPWGYGNSWLSNGFGSVEAIVICLLVIVGVGVLGFPMLLLLFSLFTTGLSAPNTGFNFIPPSSTTTVNGRRKRSTEKQITASLMNRLLEINSVNDLLALKELNGLSDLIMANVKPEIRDKAIEFFKKFTDVPENMEYIKKIIH